MNLIKKIKSRYSLLSLISNMPIIIFLSALGTLSAVCAQSIPPQLAFRLAPYYDSWYVYVKWDEAASLTGHLDVPSRYNGKDVDGTLYDLPVTVIWNLSSNISTVHIPNSIERIEDNGFATSHNLKSVVIPNSVRYVGVYAFKECTSLRSVVLSPNNEIHDSFSGCNIIKGAYAYPMGRGSFVADIEVAYPSDCIPDSAGIIFNPSLTEFYFAPWDKDILELPESVRHIGGEALAGCTKMKCLRVKAKTPPAVESTTFDGAVIKSLEVPRGCKNAYVNANGWSKFASVIKEVNTSMSINVKELALKATETSQLSVVFENPASFEDPLIWSSSDESVASVDRFGKVSANSVGTAVITATNGDLSVNCKVTVLPTPVESITLDRNTAILRATEKVQLTASVLPVSATDKTIIWTSSDENVATVDSNGLVVAHSVGNVVIKANCGGVSAECSIEVRPTLPSYVQLNKTQVYLKIGQTYYLTAIVFPPTTTDKTVTWESTDANVASVDANGKVTAIGIGKAKIKAKCGHVASTCTVEVGGQDPILATGISIDKTDISINGTEQVQLTATLSPVDVTDKTITWTSSNEEIASVDENGLVSGISDGNAIITASCGNVSSSCNVRVHEVYVSSVKFDVADITLHLSDSKQLNATVEPENANNKELIWECWDNKIATVDKTGKVTAVGLGETVISISPLKSNPYSSGLRVAFCNITVIPAEIKAEEITLSETESLLEVSELLQLHAIVSPAETTDKKVVWTSSDYGVATVDSDGLVRAVAPGETVITARCGEASATCRITVSVCSGIEMIISEAKFPIYAYTLHGVIIKIANAKDFKKLQPGCYIVNGKKFRKR